MWGHRGGFKPGNTKFAFEKALKEKLEGIEFDVWITKDSIPVIVHGGKDGELSEFGLDHKVYQVTSAELKELVGDAGDGNGIQTFEQLLQMVTMSGVPLTLNVELKGPWSPE